MNLPKPKEEHMAAIRALREVPSHSLRKGMKIFSKQLGTPVTGIIMDDYRKRSTRLIYAHGSEVGLYDEAGAVYTKDIVQVHDGDSWKSIA